MAVLTWRNVDAPNLSSATRTMLAAGGAFNDAISGARGMLAERRKANSESASREVLANALALTDADGYAAALRDGSIFGNIDRSQVSADTYNTLLGREKSLIGNQGDRLRNTNQGIINNTNQYSLDRTQLLNNRSDAEYAARPELERALAQAEGMIMSGNPEQVAAGRQIIQDRAGDLQRAGYNPSTLLRGSIGTASSGRQEQLNLYDYGNKLNNINVSEGIRGVVDKAFSDYPGNPQAALKSIQDNRNLTREEVVAATNLLGSIPENAWGTAPSGTLAKYGIGDANVLAPRPQGAFSRHIRSTESSNSPDRADTLFGHAQRRGGAFEGVRPSMMTIGQLSEFTSTSGEYGNWVKGQLAASGQEPRIATPVGEFQIVGTTLRETAKEMNLSPNTVFTPQVQEAMAYHIGQKAIKGKSMPEAIKAIKGKWEGFKNLSDTEMVAVVEDIRRGGSGASGLGDFPQATQMLADTNPFINQVEGYSPQATLEGMFGRNRPIEFTPDTPIPSVENPTVQSPEPATSTPVEVPVATPDNPFAAIDFANDQALANEVGAAQILQDTLNQQRIDQVEAAKGTSAGTRENIARAAESNMVDAAFGDSPYLTEYIRTRPDRGKSITQIVKEVAEDTGIDPLAITEVIDQLTRDNGIGLGSKRIEPDVAGALIRESTEARDLRGGVRQTLEGLWGVGAPIGTVTSWFSTPGDEWGKTNGQAKALRVDMDKLANNLSRFQNTNADGVSTSPNASALAQDRLTAEAQAQVQLLEGERAEVESWLRQKLAHIDAGILTGASSAAERAKAVDQASQAMMRINQQLDAIQEGRNPYRYHNR